MPSWERAERLTSPSPCRSALSTRLPSACSSRMRSACSSIPGSAGGDRARRLARAPLEASRDRVQEIRGLEQLEPQPELPLIGARDQQQRPPPAVSGGRPPPTIAAAPAAVPRRPRRAAAPARAPCAAGRAACAARGSASATNARSRSSAASSRVEHRVQRLAEPLDLVAGLRHGQPLAGRLGRDRGCAAAHRLDRAQRGPARP